MAKKILKLKCNGNCSVDGVLKAKIASPAVGLPPRIAFNNRHTAKVDTGLEVEVPEGYKLCIGLVQNLAVKGMVLANAPGNFTKGKVEAVLLNAGREIVEVSNGDPIVTCWLEAIVDFDWECA
jgi:dUTPase